MVTDSNAIFLSVGPEARFFMAEKPLSSSVSVRAAQLRQMNGPSRGLE